MPDFVRKAAATASAMKVRINGATAGHPALMSSAVQSTKTASNTTTPKVMLCHVPLLFLFILLSASPECRDQFTQVFVAIAFHLWIQDDARASGDSASSTVLTTSTRAQLSRKAKGIACFVFASQPSNSRAKTTRTATGCSLDQKACICLIGRGDRLRGVHGHHSGAFSNKV